MMANRQYFEVARWTGRNYWTFNCTCGLKGSIHFPKMEDAITDGLEHQCDIGWPASAKRSLYIGEAPPR